MPLAVPSQDANDHETHTSPWIPLSMVSSLQTFTPPDQFVNLPLLSTSIYQLAITTAALAFPIALLRRRRRAATSIIGGDKRPSSFLSTSTSKMNSAPPVRRRAPRLPPHHSGAGPSAIPLSFRTDNASAQTEPLAKARSSFRPPPGELSLRVSRVEQDSGFNGALYSLKAFGIATALVIAGGAASVWGVKTYLGAKNVRGLCICFF